MKIQFTRTPTGAFNLAYNEGDITEIRDELAEEIIEMGFGIKVEEQEEVVEEKPKKKGK